MGALEILYVGDEGGEAVDEIVTRGAVVHDADNVYDGIARLKRTGVGAAVIEYQRLQPDPDRAVRALRDAAGVRPVLVAMTTDEWEEIRPRGFLDQDEVLVRPFYPDELWRRVERTAMPPPAQAAVHFRNDADRLAALMDDTRRISRCTNDLSALAHQCVAVLKARLRAGRVSLFLKSKDPGRLTILGTAGLEKRVRDEAILTLGEGVAGELAQRRRVALVREAGRDGPATDRSYKGSSYMIAPLVHDNDVVGVICVTERFEHGPFRDGDLAYLQAFGEMAAQAVHNGLQYRAADELATIDELTKLFNRRYFNRVLPQEVERARRYRHDLTLAMIDVDYFKRYNDTMGHQAGDRALAAVAQVLKDSFREADIVVRYGGEEFAVIMPETSRREGNGVGFVHRARKGVEDLGLAFEGPQGRRQVLTISGGVSTLHLSRPEEDENGPAGRPKTWEELVETADRALYQAKEAGRNTIVGY